MIIGNPVGQEIFYRDVCPPPDLTLNEQVLLGTYCEFMPFVMDMLQSFHPEKPITGGDLSRSFGLWSARADRQ